MYSSTPSSKTHWVAWSMRSRNHIVARRLLISNVSGFESGIIVSIGEVWSNRAWVSWGGERRNRVGANKTEAMRQPVASPSGTSDRRESTASFLSNPGLWTVEQKVLVVIGGEFTCEDLLLLRPPYLTTTMVRTKLYFLLWSLVFTKLKSSWITVCVTD